MAELEIKKWERHVNEKIARAKKLLNTEGGALTAAHLTDEMFAGVPDEYRVEVRRRVTASLEQLERDE